VDRGGLKSHVILRSETVLRSGATKEGSRTFYDAGDRVGDLRCAQDDALINDVRGRPHGLPDDGLRIAIARDEAAAAT
jgi:hypothetical protein